MANVPYLPNLSAPVTGTTVGAANAMDVNVVASPGAGAHDEDDPHASGDAGVQMLGVRNDADAVLTDTDGDYSPLAVTSTGRLKVDATVSEVATAADGAALSALIKVVGGYDGAAVQVLETDANGRASVNVIAAIPAGDNNIGNMDVASLPGTVEADIASIAAEDFATETTLAAVLADTATMDASLTSLAAVDFATQTTLAAVLADTAAMDTNLATIAAEDFATETTLAALNAKVTAVNTGAVTISAALPTGTNTIGNVNLNRLTVVDMIDTTPLLDASTVLGSAGAFKEIVASTAAQVREIQVMSTMGIFVGVYTGAAASEALVAVFGPGADYNIQLAIAAGTRVALRSMETTAGASGEFVAINFLG